MVVVWVVIGLLLVALPIVGFVLGLKIGAAVNSRDHALRGAYAALKYGEDNGYLTEKEAAIAFRFAEQMER